MCIGSPGGLVKTQTAGPHPRVSDSVVLGQNRRICISNTFPGSTDAVGLEMTL